ncbi:outer membrane beta-barrel protein [Aequorivita marisscotiae]|uniref:Outer membrane beta-barrel protein n=1 Tax=Aequorivita marisscotiae TaxID=3040348 RepID=A0ABY8KW96_9FLAO|nr:outer membrane beta-barrel protein [Aequorivita sp. Ant34-E75]WGF92455.1 outer membrane beta-barrel protein [Aequorivita sp. Ant34-E75]
MKLNLFFATLLLATVSAFSQTNFEPGYIIQSNGTQVDCLIKNEDWKGSPTTFVYKLSENGETKIGSVATINEFGSKQSFKYIKATVQIDQSSDVVNNLTFERNPEYKEETVFLKTLVSGKASLYFTFHENAPRYFYSVGDGEIEQLIYKRYLVTRIKMGTNEFYKQQLANSLTCNSVTENNFENLQYKMSNLVNIITKYNDCENSESIVYNKNKQKAKFNLSVRPGVAFSSFSMQRRGDELLHFDSDMGIRVGLEAEYILPFNNGKWSIFIEPTYRSYKTEKQYLYVDMITFQKYTTISVNYTSVELPLGGRHYMFVNKDAAFFIDAAVIMDLTTLDSEITSTDEDSYDLNVSADAALAFGLGFRYKNKYSLQARYHSGRQLLNYDNINSTYKSFAIVAGYNFL